MKKLVKRIEGRKTVCDIYTEKVVGPMWYKVYVNGTIMFMTIYEEQAVKFARQTVMHKG